MIAGSCTDMAGHGSLLQLVWLSSGRVKGSHRCSSTIPVVFSTQWTICLWTPGIREEHKTAVETKKHTVGVFVKVARPYWKTQTVIKTDTVAKRADWIVFLMFILPSVTSHCLFYVPLMTVWMFSAWTNKKHNLAPYILKKNIHY